MTRVTNKLVAEWKASTLPVPELARLYQVADTTIYYHINRRHAERRREQWRAYRAKRRGDPSFREAEREATRRYRKRVAMEGKANG